MTEFLTKLVSFNTLFFVAGFLVLNILVGIVIKKRKQSNKPVVAPNIMRYFLLPTILLDIICRFSIALPRTSFPVKITETILIIFLIIFFLNLINHLFFSEKNIITSKEALPKLGRDIIEFILVLIASSFVFSSIWNFDLGNMLAALGVGSFVLGLALQEPLGNLFNGITLLVAKPFDKGDWVEIGSDTGKIVDFNWRSAKLINRFNELIVIPNNKVAKERIKNLSRPNKIHAELITIGFSYDDSPQKVKQMLLDIAEQTENILKHPSPLAITISYDDFYINYGLKFYINDYEDQILMSDQIMTKIYEATKKSGLTIPYPIQDLRIRNQ